MHLSPPRAIRVWSSVGPASCGSSVGPSATLRPGPRNNDEVGRTISPPHSAKQGRPGRIGSVLRGRYLALIGAAQVDRVQASRSAVSTRIGRRLAEIHQHPAVRSPGGPFYQEIPSQQPFTGPIRVHHTDVERSAVDLSESDQIAARRPDWGAVFPRTKADPFGVPAIRAHDVELLGAAAIGIEDDPAAVGSKAG